jgi:hypothetical protein
MHNDDEPGEGATGERKGDLITLLGQSRVKPKGSVCFGLNYFVQSQCTFTSRQATCSEGGIVNG